MTEPEIRTATDADVPRVHALLRAADLPIPGADDPPVTFRVATSGGAIVAANGYETHDTYALLRSVVVAEDARGSGVGSALVASTLSAMDTAGWKDVMLVTMDAAAFFERLGFRSIDREDVPAPLRRSPEYRMHECLGGQWMRRNGEVGGF